MSPHRLRQVGFRRPEIDLVQLVAVRLELNGKVVAVLEVHPEPVRGAQRPGQPESRVRADCPLSVHNLIDAPGRHVDRLRQPVLADPKRCEELLQQNLPRMNRRVSGTHVVLLFSVVVGDLDVSRAGRCPGEANPPL